MKRTLFLLISLYLGLVGANAQSNKYDLNEDGDVNITDVIELVNYILGLNNGNQGGGGNETNAAGEAVDLGLPSGTKWASCNVGATKPEENGGYYSWGETEEKSRYDIDNYKYKTQDDVNTYVSIGSDISGTDYDVAHVKWGSNWCMPTHDEQKELIDNCTRKLTTLNGVNGCKFTSKINGNSIFLPAAGNCIGATIYDVNHYGYYWSSTQYPDVSEKNTFAYRLYFESGGYISSGNYNRYRGYSVRPVWKE